MTQSLVVFRQLFVCELTACTMVDILFRSSMNVVSQPLAIPATHQRRIERSARSPLFLSAAPVAVSNKIRAIQARKTRITLVSTNAVHTDVRPLNFNCKSGVAKSRTDFPVFTAERLVDRSKDFRLERISARQPSRPSTILQTSNNQASLLWPNRSPSAKFSKQINSQSNSTAHTPTALDAIKPKSAVRKMPEVPTRPARQLSVDALNPLLPDDVRDKSKSKPHTSRVARFKSHDRLTHQQHHPQQQPQKQPTQESENEDDDLQMDEEFEEYLEKAIVKCADWLIKYVFV